MADPKTAHEDVAVTGHDYDGIQEFDNRLPRWWLATLWIAVVFSFFYWAYYHVYQVGPSSMAAYRAELDEANRLREERELALEKAGKGVDDEQLLALSHDAEALARGKTIFDTNCAACHRPDGGGLIGPNLADAYFLHGAKPLDTYKVVGDGVPAKGMPAWKPMFGGAGTKDVTAYVLSLRGKPVQGGKEPQGELARGAAQGAAQGGEKSPPPEGEGAKDAAPTGDKTALSVGAPVVDRE